MTVGPLQEGKAHKATDRIEGHVKTEADAGLIELRARNTEGRQSHQQLERKERILL